MIDIEKEIHSLRMAKHRKIRDIQMEYDERVYALQMKCDHDFGLFEYYGEDFYNREIEVRTCDVCGYQQKRNITIENMDTEK